MKEQLLEALKYFDENDELILQRKEDLERNISQTTEMYKNTIKIQWEQIKELINKIDKAISFLKNIGYDEEMGRIWNDMNDDECTELLKILEGGKK